MDLLVGTFVFHSLLEFFRRQADDLIRILCYAKDTVQSLKVFFRIDDLESEGFLQIRLFRQAHKTCAGSIIEFFRVEACPVQRQLSFLQDPAPVIFFRDDQAFLFIVPAGLIEHQQASVTEL